MRADFRQMVLATGLSLAGLLGVAPPSAHAQQGAVGGVVTDAATSGPLEAARVILTGPNRIETTNQEGRFMFRDVSPGRYQIRVLRLGYAPVTDSAIVAPGETVALEIAMTPAPVQLDEIVTTATGEQRKLEVANAVSTIDAAAIAEQAPIAEFGNLISGRAAGVQVQKAGGTTGSGTRIRIRGSNSVSLSNEPLYYIDGIRMESGATSSTLDIGGFGGGFGAAPSRINDLNPDDIESIEIVKGPAAATLYGIQASNGVVRVTTKRGRAGKPRWNLFVETGSVSDHNTYPLNFIGHDALNTDPETSLDGFCIVQFELDGDCTQTSVEQSSPLVNPATRPFKAGLRQQYGANVSGGTEQITYYLSGDYESETGVYRLPQFEEDSIRADLGDVPGTQIRPNALERVSLRANISANLSADADLQANVGYISSDTRFVENDNSFLTIIGSGEASGVDSATNRGWFFTPAELFAELAQQSAERFIGGLTGNWRPASWLSTRATVGYDITNRQDVQFFPTGAVADYLQNREGVKFDNRFQLTQTSVDLAATGRFRLSQNLSSKTTVGSQFFRDKASGVLATGRGLPAGSGTITGAGTTEAKDTTVESRSLGMFVEEEIGIKDRIFLTGALRFDDNSAFGQNFDATVYPKASVSWLLSEEPFWEAGFLSTLRLRAAFGVSGQQPGTTDALRFFSPVAGKKAGVPEPGISFGSLGNADLKPERSSELELGLDASLIRDRVSLEFTYYTKKTQDALVERLVAPSVGASSTQFFNLGEVSNHGFELAINARVVDTRSFTWDLSLSGSLNDNKLIELGEGVEPIIFGFGLQRHAEGYPLGGYWSRPITGFEDANGDGIIASDEFTVGDEAIFRGRALPNKEAALNSSIGLFDGKIRIGTQFDYRGGHYIDNAMESFRCTPVLNCRGLVDRTAPLEEQARGQALLNEATEWGYFEPAWFIKLRELSLTFFAPDSWARSFRSTRLSLTLAGRNLLTIDDYSGVDPEVNAFGQENFSTSDFESQPQVRYWTARLNIGF